MYVTADFYFNFYWLNVQVFILWKNAKKDEIESSQLGFSIWNNQCDNERISKIKNENK